MSDEKIPIESLMKTTLENVKDMIDVNTIVGNPIETSDGNVLIPISKVSFGFASGGGEYNNSATKDEGDSYPFAGGSGAAITLQPVAFMVVDKGETRLLSVEQNANMVDNILTIAPKILDSINNIFSNNKNEIDFEKDDNAQDYKCNCENEKKQGKHNDSNNNTNADDELK